MAGISYAGLLLGYLNKGLLFAWYMTTDQVGLTNLVVGVGLMFAQLANLGSINTVWKFFPFFRNRERQNSGFLPFLLLIVLAGVVVFTLIAVLFREYIISFYQDRSEEFVDYYYLIIPLGIASVFFLLFDSYLRSLYRNVVPVFVNDFLLRFLVTADIAALGFQWISFHTFLLLHCVIYLIPAVVLIIYTAKIGELNLNFRSIAIGSRFRKIIFYYTSFSYMNSIGAMLVVTIDTLMIASMLGLFETGIYTTVVYLTSALQIPYRSIVRVSSPLVSDYWKERANDKMQKLYTQVSSVSLFLGIVMFMLVWINRSEVFSVLPEQYSLGIPVFLFLMCGRLVDFYCGLNGGILVMSRKYRYDVLFTVFLLTMVIVLNYLLIPPYGITGAAISTSIALVLYNAARVLFVLFSYRIHPFNWLQVKVILLFGANVLLFEVLPSISDNIILSAAFKTTVFLLLFVGPIFLFRLEPETIRLVTNFVNKRLRKKDSA